MTTFNSLQDAEDFKKSNADLLMRIQAEVEAVPGVVSSEVWLNGNPPSFIVGLDSEDNHFVYLKIVGGC